MLKLTLGVRSNPFEEEDAKKKPEEKPDEKPDEKLEIRKNPEKDRSQDMDDVMDRRRNEPKSDHNKKTDDEKPEKEESGTGKIDETTTKPSNAHNQEGTAKNQIMLYKLPHFSKSVTSLFYYPANFLLGKPSTPKSIIDSNEAAEKTAESFPGLKKKTS